jgi:hypothetical protein
LSAHTFSTAFPTPLLRHGWRVDPPQATQLARDAERLLFVLQMRRNSARTNRPRT